MTTAPFVASLIALALAGGEPCPLQWSTQFAADGVAGVATELMVHDDGAGGGPALYVAGEFSAAGGLPATNIARWNGSAWSTVGEGLNGSATAPVNDLHAYDFGAGQHLLAAGMHNLFGVDQLAQWDGRAWQSAPPGLPDAWLASLGVFNGELYVSGAFFHQTSPYFLRWNGTAWAGVGGGLGSVVWDQKVFDDGSGPSLFVAGIPIPDGNFNALGIARWDGAQWHALGTGVNGEGRALAVFDDGSGDGPALYLGGQFTTAGGAPAWRIARWRNNQWSALGAGFNGQVNTLAVFDDGAGSGPALYAGGEFALSGATVVNNLAKWNGASWEPVGGGTSGSVHALTVFDEDGPGPIAPALYVAGEFTHAGGQPSLSIARWGRCAIQPCPADINSSGGVDVSDLLMVINAWGDCPAPPALCPADTNASGAVDVTDLLAVINAWGPCP